MGDFIKFRSGEIVFVGGPLSAARYIQAKGQGEDGMVNAVATADNNDIASSGDWGTSIAGMNAVAMSMDFGNSVGRDNSLCTSEFKGNTIVGDYGHAVVGDHGNAISGLRGASIGGNGAFAKSGDFGLSAVGSRGIALSGVNGIVQGGPGASLMALYVARNGLRSTKRICHAIVGEGGILPYHAYRAVEGRFVAEEGMIEEDREHKIARHMHSEIFNSHRMIGGVI